MRKNRILIVYKNYFRGVISILVTTFGLPLVVFGQNELPSSKVMSVNPDSYTMVLSKGGEKWDNKVGGLYDQAVMHGPKCNVNVWLGGFINIHDFTTGQLMSWQLWRGNIGLGARFQLHDVKWMGNENSFSAMVAAVHESQHASDVFGYAYKYLHIIPQNFDNSRSFESFQFRLDYRYIGWEKFKMELNIGYKLYPDPILSDAPHILENSLFAESGFEWEFMKNGTVYSKLFIEMINNSFNAVNEGYLGSWDGAPFLYRILESGVYYRNPKDKLIGVFVNYSNSNGRGLDFIDQNEQFGLGLRLDIN